VKFKAVSVEMLELRSDNVHFKAAEINLV